MIYFKFIDICDCFYCTVLELLPFNYACFDKYRCGVMFNFIFQPHGSSSNSTWTCLFSFSVQEYTTWSVWHSVRIGRQQSSYCSCCGYGSCPLHLQPATSVVSSGCRLDSAARSCSHSRGSSPLAGSFKRCRYRGSSGASDLDPFCH